MPARAVQLIPDGDIAGVIWTTDPEETGIDIYLGSGGAPEGVLAAAALRCIGGQMQGRLMPLKPEERERADKMGADVNRKYTMPDMASGDVHLLGHRRHRRLAARRRALPRRLRRNGDRHHARQDWHRATHQDHLPRHRDQTRRAVMPVS